MKRVHGDRVTYNKCQKTFSSKNNMRIHGLNAHDQYVSMATKSMKIKYNCSKCDKTYGNKDKHEWHESTFTGKKPVLVKCDLCDKDLKSSIERHIRSKHKIVMGSGENYLLVKEKSKPNIAKKITCHHWHKDFKRKYNLKTHIKKFHTFTREDKSFDASNKVFFGQNFLSFHSDQESYSI